MAFLRHATALVVHPRSSPAAWSRTRRAAKVTGQPGADLAAQASEILGENFDPNKYLLTHCTLVASVDTETVPGVKLGQVKEDGKKIHRKYANFRVTANTDQYINNNLDCFSRAVLLKSYRTLIGSYNFVEHVQIEDQAKGRIIDAVTRDIGESVYVDILVATDRRHTELVADIEEGRLGTLSMGCFLPGTMVSMADGTRVPIEEVQPGDMVITHKGRVREVMNKQMRSGIWNMRRVQVHGVPTDIVATCNHPFFVYRPAPLCGCGCGAQLPELKARHGKNRANSSRRMGRRFLRGHNKRVFNPNSTYSLDEFRQRKARVDTIHALRLEEVRADEIRPGDFVTFPRARHTGTDLLGKARLLGYFVAEGSFLKYKGDPVEVQFNFSMGEKATFVQEVVQLLQEEFPQSRPWVQDWPERDLCVVHTYGRDVAGWFHAHGGEYSHAKRLSTEVMSWSTEAHLQLVGAWINGDGTLAKSGATSGTTTSFALACQMHLLMARCGLHARIECNVAGRSVDVREVVNGGFVMRDELTGKLPALTLTLGQTDAQPLRAYCDKIVPEPTCGQRALRLTDEHILYQVTSNDVETYEGWVHDMEVEEDHSYIVEGVAVHNCSVETTTCTKCGNVAVDETELCNCVKYAKGNVFLDERGGRHRIAELCFPPGTRVVTGDGSRRPIEDLQVGDVVLTHAGRRREILHTFERRHVGALVALDITGIPQTLRSTPNHPYYVLSPRDTCACGCGTPLQRRGDGGHRDFMRTFAVGHHPSHAGAQSTSVPVPEFKAAADVREGDMLILPPPVEVIVPKDVDARKAWLLGWFLAEGNYLKTAGNKTGIQLTLNAVDEVGVAQEIAKKLADSFPPETDGRLVTTVRLLEVLDQGPATSHEISQILSRKPGHLHGVLQHLFRKGLISRRPLTSDEKITRGLRRKGITYLWSVVAGADRSVLSVHPRVHLCPRSEGGEKLVVCYQHRGAAAWFDHHAGEYAGTKRLSVDAILWPVALQREMLRGYVNGDGGADDLDRFSVGSVSETLISQMQVVAARCGFWTRRQVTFGGKSVELMAVVGGDGVPTDDLGWRPTHTLHFQPSEGVTLAFSGDVGRERGLAPAWRNHMGGMLHRVRGVSQEMYVGPVYNIEVADDHTYLVEGIAVHNCGHETIDPTGGVTFIEASWVASPAFTGAVMRNIIVPTELSTAAQKKAQQVLSTPPKEWVDIGQRKAASEVLLQEGAVVGKVSDRRAAVSTMAAFDFDNGGEDEASPPSEPEKSQPNKLDDLEDQVMDAVTDRVLRRVKDELDKKKPRIPPEDSSISTNDNLNASERVKVARRAYAASIEALVTSASSDADVVNRVAILDAAFGMKAAVDVYRTALLVGSSRKFASVESHLRACRDVLERPFGPGELRAFLRLGRILTCAEDILRNTPDSNTRSTP